MSVKTQQKDERFLVRIQRRRENGTVKERKERQREREREKIQAKEMRAKIKMSFDIQSNSDRLIFLYENLPTQLSLHYPGYIIIISRIFISWTFSSFWLLAFRERE